MYYIKEIYMCLYSVDGEATTGIITGHCEDHTNMFHKSDVLFLKVFGFVGCVIEFFVENPVLSYLAILCRLGL